MRDEEVMLTVVFFTTSVAVVWLALVYWHKRERLRTIQKAIESDRLDEGTRRVLLDALAADGRRAVDFAQRLWGNLVRTLRALVFVGGWLTLCIGGGMWLAAALSGHASRYETEPAMVATFVGFALVTLPLAMRELDGRRAEGRT